MSQVIDYVINACDLGARSTDVMFIKFTNSPTFIFTVGYANQSKTVAKHAVSAALK